MKLPRRTFCSPFFTLSPSNQMVIRGERKHHVPCRVVQEVAQEPTVYLYPSQSFMFSIRPCFHASLFCLISWVPFLLFPFIFHTVYFTGHFLTVVLIKFQTSLPFLIIKDVCPQHKKTCVPNIKDVCSPTSKMWVSNIKDVSLQHQRYESSTSKMCVSERQCSDDWSQASHPPQPQPSGYTW